MQRFEIRRFRPEYPKGQNPYVLILQARGVDAVPSVVVAPLERRQRNAQVLLYELSVEIAGTASHLEWEIGRALDRLLFGV